MIRRTLARSALVMGALMAGVLSLNVSAQTQPALTTIPNPMAGCSSPDRSVLGQYAWGMALRWGSPALLDQLVQKNCIDPNAWRQLGVDQAPLINQVQRPDTLNEALALGWRPDEQLALNRRRDPSYLNPLMAMILRPLPIDDEARQMFKQAQAKYGFTLATPEKSIGSVAHEDAMIAVAKVLPLAFLNEQDSFTGVTPLILASAGKYDRLVTTMLQRGALWATTYTPMKVPPARGMWDAAFDTDNCVLKTRSQNDGALSAMDIQNSTDRIMGDLRSLWVPNTLRSTSARVPGLALDMLTGEALWTKPADWAILQKGQNPTTVAAAQKQATAIVELQKQRKERWDYNALMGTAVPDAVCATLQQH